MKKINTNKDRLDTLVKRGNLIKESFKKEFDKIKRVNESEDESGAELFYSDEFNNANKDYTDNMFKNMKKVDKDGNESELKEGPNINNEDFHSDMADGNRNFKPQVGMVPSDPNGNGYKGRIEHVGEDYFVLRSFRGDKEPVMIKPFMYHSFINYRLEDGNSTL